MESRRGVLCRVRFGEPACESFQHGDGLWRPERLQDTDCSGHPHCFRQNGVRPRASSEQLADPRPDLNRQLAFGCRTQCLFRRLPDQGKFRRGLLPDRPLVIIQLVDGQETDGAAANDRNLALTYASQTQRDGPASNGYEAVGVT